jgi:uncharacterized protein YjbI with pentapeptide repeats
MLTEDYLLDIMVSAEQTIENKTFEANIFLNFKDKEIPLNKHKRIRFLECSFKGFSMANLRIENSTLEFINCTFHRLRLLDSKLTDLHFDDCTAKNISLYSSEINSIHIGSCDIKTELLLSKLKGGFGNIVNGKISKITIYSNEFEVIDITSKNTIDTIELHAFNSVSITGGVKKINSNLGEFNKLEIEALYENIDKKDGSGKKEPSIVANKIEELSIAWNSFNGSVKIEDLEIEHLTMNDVNNEKGFMRFNELKISKADFRDVAIKSFYWNQVVFKDELRIERCDFSSLKIANVKWLTNSKKLSDSFIDEEVPLFYLLRKRWFERFKKNEDSNNVRFLYSWRKKWFGDLHCYDDEDLSILQYERETYRQLKATSISNHNLLDSLDFYRNEMRLHWKEMRINGERNWADRFLVFVNRIVSDFGQNWWWPLLWLFAIHFWLVFCLFSGEWVVHLKPNQQIGFWGEYFNLLIPIHKMPDYITTDGGKITDFVMRIFSSYFIYHFIQASRKFGKA